jgi:hypothetical protein
MVYFVRSCRMQNGYFRRLISSAIDVNRYALLLRSLKVAGRRGAIASRTKDGQAGCGGCESAITAQYGGPERTPSNISLAKLDF